ncbi:legumin J-like [Ooceraea biroi]|uniref:legumin J-like n=1 Tax=Ooceraea biroi TaxID=2015173 RepID=UPI000F085D4E|nr:legumin J-like [Ooceraea biroi]
MHRCHHQQQQQQREEREAHDNSVRSSSSSTATEENSMDSEAEDVLQQECLRPCRVRVERLSIPVGEKSESQFPRLTRRRTATRRLSSSSSSEEQEKEDEEEHEQEEEEENRRGECVVRGDPIRPQSQAERAAPLDDQRILR